MCIGGGPVSLFSGAVLKFSILAENCGINFKMASSSNNKVTWSVEATESLIDIYNVSPIQASLENSKTSKENSKIVGQNR